MRKEELIDRLTQILTTLEQAERLSDTRVTYELIEELINKINYEL